MPLGALSINYRRSLLAKINVEGSESFAVWFRGASHGRCHELCGATSTVRPWILTQQKEGDCPPGIPTLQKSTASREKGRPAAEKALFRLIYLYRLVYVPKQLTFRHTQDGPRT